MIKLVSHSSLALGATVEVARRADKKLHLVKVWLFVANQPLVWFDTGNCLDIFRSYHLGSEFLLVDYEAGAINEVIGNFLPFVML